MIRDRVAANRGAARQPDLARRRLLGTLGVVPFAFAGLPSSALAAPRTVSAIPPGRVMIVSATAGYRHDSIPTALRVLREIASQEGSLSVETVIEDTGGLGALSASTLANHDLLVFANTSGELPLDEVQKAAILDFVAGGKGFVGTHSASDTFYQWAAYGDLIGAYFDSHPWVQSASVVVEDDAHSATRGLDPAFRIEEEFYTFRQSPRPLANVLLRLDAASVGAEGDFPLAWWKIHGAGRVYYNALGHFPATWEDPRFQLQLRGALRWAAGLEPGYGA